MARYFVPMVRRACALTLLFISFALTVLPGVADASRGRPIVSGNTLKTDDGQLIRGGPIVVWKGGNGAGAAQTASAIDITNMTRLRDDLHMNAARLIAFDAYNFSHGDQYFTVDEAVAYYDQIVNNAEALNMYVIINYHDVGSYSTSGEWSLTNFWTKIAPRYKDRTNVIYELANEPAMWDASVYTTQVLTDLANTYKNVIRPLAPNSPVLHLTYSSTGVSMISTVQSYTALANVSWASGKDVVAFHGYNASSANISALKAAYPVFNTEWDYPGNPDNNPLCTIDGELYMAQSMERLGISWLDWRAGRGNDNTTANQLLPDALSKGYAWWQGGGGTTNVALGKPASASSEYNSDYTATRGVDGNVGTAWSPTGNDTRPWLQIDLGQPVAAQTIELVTRQDYDQPETRRNFEIRGSNDPGFATYSVLGARGATPLPYQGTGTTTVTDTTPYRYIRAAKTVDEYFFANELRVLVGGGGANTNLALNKVTGASSSYNSSYSSAAAVDGSTAGGWSPSGSDTQPFLQVDLGSAATISSIELVTRQDYDQPEVRRNFEVWASNNADMSQGHVVLGSVGSAGLAHQSTWTLPVTGGTSYRYVAFRKSVAEYFFIAEVRILGSQ